mgnify:CR=1
QTTSVNLEIWMNATLPPSSLSSAINNFEAKWIETFGNKPFNNSFHYFV